MEMLRILAQALGVAYVAGLNLYATVAVLGLATRFGWIDPLPGALGLVANAWVITIALGLFLFEFVATLIPGVASAWETLHGIVRVPAAAVLAAVTAWYGDALVVLAAALLGGALALVTYATKLGLRYAIDTSAEPATNAVANVVELGAVTLLLLLLWAYPLTTLSIALLLLVGLVVTVRVIGRVLHQVLSGHWMPGCGLLQEPRPPRPEALVVEEDD